MSDFFAKGCNYETEQHHFYSTVCVPLALVTGTSLISGQLAFDNRTEPDFFLNLLIDYSPKKNKQKRIIIVTYAGISTRY